MMPPASSAALAGMPARDIVETRELKLAALVGDHRAGNTDAVKVGIAWVAALVGEMRQRGSGDRPVGPSDAATGSQRERRDMPSNLSILAMTRVQVLESRELWISSLVNHWNRRTIDAEADAGINLALGWITALTSEMRIRGSSDGDLNKANA